MTSSPIRPSSPNRCPGRSSRFHWRFSGRSFRTNKSPDEEQKLRAAAEWRKAVLAKPEAERTHQEQQRLSVGPSLQTIGDFSYHDWERLSIHDDHRSFWPPSPLREPFHSLFQSSPDEALRLLRELCNHAMTAWRQLHRHSRDRGGTPIPLELTFPWGTQRFWGTDREYLWFRSTWAPKVIGCGFMALEEWCFAELARSRPVDELIQKIVEGNECIAILGIASMLALHTETVSEATLPLFTSQRLLAADHNRMVQDFLVNGEPDRFQHRTDKPHFEAVQAANARPVRRTQLSWMVPRFIFATGPIRTEPAMRSSTSRTICHFSTKSTATIRRHGSISRLRPSNMPSWQTGKTIRPTAPKRIPIRLRLSTSALLLLSLKTLLGPKRHLNSLGRAGLWTWASKSFEEKALNDTYTVEDAIALAKEADAIDLFEHSKDEDEARAWVCVEARSPPQLPSCSTSEKGAVKKILSGLVTS